MVTVRIQGESDKQKGIYFEYDPSDTPLGEGGMGKVYKGWCCNESTNQRREVAIKFLYSDLPAHVIARARREAAVQLRNDNLIEMLGFVEIGSRDDLGQSIVRYHVISEYLHGVTLDKLLNGVVTDNKDNVIPFAQELYGKYQHSPYSFAITIVRSLLSGLMALHDSGYIHRDIDPSNIMVTSNGKIKLIDFGIAKRISGNNTKESSYTVDGQFIGKPKYAAPELVRGLVDSQNYTTDLYAVGILLYQLLVGKVPFDGEMAEVLEMQLNRKMPLKNVKQKQIREVIETATQKKRSQRFQSAAEFRVAVDKLMPLDCPGKSFDPKKAGLVIGSAAVLAGIIVGGIKFINRIPDNDGADREDIYANDISSSSSSSGNDNVARPNGFSSNTYSLAVDLLSNKETAAEGLTMLKDLAHERNYSAAFLLSRLYFSSDESVDVGAFTDSVTRFRKNVGLAPHNPEAHRLLKDAVAINPNDYRSLFELGCDFKSSKRGATENRDSAYICLEKARILAEKDGALDYLKLIKRRMANLRKPKNYE